jgi:hypothetical protein
MDAGGSPLGWVESAVQRNSLGAALQLDAYALPRAYKTLEVDAETGAVKLMKFARSLEYVSTDLGFSSRRRAAADRAISTNVDHRETR